MLCRDLEVQLKMEQVHIAPTSNKLAGHRTAGSYRNYGERLYVEGRLDAMRREQEVGAAQSALPSRLAFKNHAARRVQVTSAACCPLSEIAGTCAACLQAQRAKEEEAEAELEGYTFQPSISKLAQQLKEAEGGCSSSVAAGQRLYQRAQGTAKRQVGSALSTTAVSRLGCGGALLRWAEGPPGGLVRCVTASSLSRRRASSHCPSFAPAAA